MIFSAKKRHFDILANKVVVLFPLEDKSIYYIPSKKIKNTQIYPRGKIYDFYKKLFPMYCQVGLVSS